MSFSDLLVEMVVETNFCAGDFELVSNFEKIHEEIVYDETYDFVEREWRTDYRFKLNYLIGSFTREAVCPAYSLPRRVLVPISISDLLLTTAENFNETGGLVRYENNYVIEGLRVPPSLQETVVVSVLFENGEWSYSANVPIRYND